MRLTPILIALVAFGGAMWAISSFYYDLQVSYNPPNSTSMVEFAKFNASFNFMANMTGQLQNHTVGATTKSFLDWSKYQDVLFIMFDVGGLLLTVPGLIITYANQLFALVPFVPRWFMWTVAIIIALTFTLRVVSIFMKTEEI